MPKLFDTSYSPSIEGKITLNEWNPFLNQAGQWYNPVTRDQLVNPLKGWTNTTGTPGLGGLRSDLRTMFGTRGSFQLQAGGAPAIGRSIKNLPGQAVNTVRGTGQAIKSTANAVKTGSQSVANWVKNPSLPSMNTVKSTATNFGRGALEGTRGTAAGVLRGGVGLLKGGANLGGYFGGDYLGRQAAGNVLDALGVENEEAREWATELTAAGAGAITGSLASSAVAAGAGALGIGGGIGAGGALAAAGAAAVPAVALTAAAMGGWKAGRGIERWSRGDESTWSWEDRAAYAETDSKGFGDLALGAVGLDDAGFRGRELEAAEEDWKTSGRAAQAAANQKQAKQLQQKVAETQAQEAATGSLSADTAASFQKEADERGIDFIKQNYGRKLKQEYRSGQKELTGELKDNKMSDAYEDDSAVMSWAKTYKPSSKTPAAPKTETAPQPSSPPPQAAPKTETAPQTQSSTPPAQTTTASASSGTEAATAPATQPSAPRSSIQYGQDYYNSKGKLSIGGNLRMVREEYYNRLKNSLTEEIGINFSAYEPNRKAHRKARLYQNQLETRPEMSWSGDTTVEAPDLPPEPTETINDPESFVKSHVIDLMTKAQEKGIKMTHGEAHKIATNLLKDKMNG